MLDLLQFNSKTIRITIVCFLFNFIFLSLFADMQLDSRQKPEHLNINPESQAKKAVINDSEAEKIGVVATVNGATITVMDILEVCGRQEAQLPYIYKGSQLRREVEKLRLDTLKQVIDRKLIYQEFKEKGFELPKSIVEENLDRLMKSFNVKTRKEFEEKLEASGLTMAEFRAKANENLAVELLINDKCFIDVYITPKHVYEYYKNHKREYSSPEEILLQVIKLKTDGTHKGELDTVVAHLQKVLSSNSDNEFEDAVLLYSEGPNVNNGGEIGWIEKAKLRTDFLEVLQNANRGDIVGPVKAEEGYYFIRVADIRFEKAESFKQVKKNIRNMLTMEQRKNRYDKYVESLRAKAYIKKYL